MVESIGEIVSRIRNSIKAVKEDAFITDRFIWSLVTKYAKLYVARKDSKNILKKFGNLWVTLPCVDLVEVDKIEACCGGITSGCTIMRTRDKIPTPFMGPNGMLFRTIGSIDYSKEMYPSDPARYTSLTKLTSFKYNTNRYYWYLNGYMYFPNIDWEAVRIEGVWEDDVNDFACDGKDAEGACTPKQDQRSNIPGQLLAEIEEQILAKLIPTAQLPADGNDDKKNIYR